MSSFNFQFSNIPTINLRIEFNKTYGFLHSEEAVEALRGPIKVVRTPMLIWGGMPDDLMTLLLQRAILGVEAYLPAALMETAAHAGKVSKELFDKLHNPFALGSKSVVANIYHRMPTELDPTLSLKHYDQSLYERTAVFYREVRNPLFHGQQLSHTSIESVRSTFHHLALLYAWLDKWYDPEHLWPGGSSFAGVHLKYPPEREDEAP